MGIGGERIQDMTKGIAYYAGLPAIIISTVASTDPPCSSLSVIYRDNGEFDRYLFLDRCPDGAVIAKAPAKLLVAGKGNGMATYFEARICRASGSNNQKKLGLRRNNRRSPVHFIPPLPVPSLWRSLALISWMRAASFCSYSSSVGA